jgi:UDP-N-acetylmuramoylalanine--D-glutamate ligase
MIPLPFLTNKAVAVFGLGKSGRATVAACLASGAEVHAWDDAEGARNTDNWQLTTGNAPLHLTPIDAMPWERIESLILSPGVPLHHPTPHPVVVLARAAGVEVICDIELLYRACPDARFIAITGTNGKSTTTNLIAHLLAVAEIPHAMGGNIGIPALSLESAVPSPASGGGLGGECSAGSAPPLLTSPRKRGEGITYILELSSYQSELLDRFRPNIAVWLNITPDHLSRHGGMEGYIAAKEKLFARQGADDTAILCEDDAPSREIAQRLRTRGDVKVRTVLSQQENPLPVGEGRVREADVSCPNGGVKEHSNADKDTLTLPSPTGRGFTPPGSLRAPAPPQGGGNPDALHVANGLLHDGTCTHDISGIPTLLGTHNAQNVGAAWAVGACLGIAPEVMLTAIRTYPGLPHRIEPVATLNSVRFVNDSKATNAEATTKALACFEDIFWIAGGQPKEDGLSAITPFLPRIRAAYLIGEAEEAFAQWLSGKVPVVRCGTLAHAVERAAQDAWKSGLPDAVVLLSPACASFDQWANFEARGEGFRQSVQALSIPSRETV